jgi:HlyD family secretion protein
MPSHIRRILPLVLLLALVAVAVVYLVDVSASEDGPLTASGTVEAVQISIAPELSGKIAAVHVVEGQAVQAGEELFELEGELLRAQKDRGGAALETAEAQLVAARAAHASASAGLESARVQEALALQRARTEARPSRRAAWQVERPDPFELPAWYFEKEEALLAAEAELQAAQDELDNERARLEDVRTQSASRGLIASEKRLSQAEAAYLIAQDLLDRAEDQDEQTLEEFAEDLFEAAESELEAAQSEYDQLLSEQAASDLLEARARFALARERHETALDRLESLQTGEHSLQVQAAVAAREQAETQVEQAQANVAQAEKALAQARVELVLLDIQIDKLTVFAPTGGVVTMRGVEPGEVVQAGAACMTLDLLDELTITVYLHEDRYGLVRLGDHAVVTVDSFPEETFTAEVIRIADRAEYTPRNVQTEEGRRTTVFAVELAMQDPAGRLKPGMPADIRFQE